jgi:DNA-directed RNA polymerase subunit F
MKYRVLFTISVILCGQHILSSYSYADETVKTKKSENIINVKWHLSPDFLKQQVNQSLSPGRAVKSLISHYPESITSIVSVALDEYPKQYKEIIYSAVSAQPYSSEEIVTIAVNKGISESTNIVETAISAEPSYASFVATAAMQASPNDFTDILRIAVTTEPNSADKLVQSVAKSYPERITEILSNTVKYVPKIGEYVVDALLAVFPDDAQEVVSITVREAAADKGQLSKIIDSAINAGIDTDVVAQYAIQGGATKEEVNLVIAQRNEIEKSNKYD